ncbi:hypothetical protein [Xylophilus sp. GOD-11R]|uniref:hypothetical protein n=1 Tax=Xylophilus sp. GOD-11R TaxID=3089814 RepID=UPI00298BF2FA|nr:hypothetical protein [Xylophilus sp. GOD-11R]WPB58113.1 hypothetical protein R9X41_05595 [Xylophilus sp. GOD-11R]
MSSHPRPFRACLLSIGLTVWASLHAPWAVAATACSSDGHQPPRVLVERFLPDSCTECWARPTSPADRNAFVIDWIVPGTDPAAPMAAAALPEAGTRLATLGYTADTPEPQFWKWRHPVLPTPTGRLRVAQGPVVDDYIGVSIAWAGKGPSGAVAGPVDAWLLLVEDLPPGTAGSPAARRLVRAAMSVEQVDLRQERWQERRSMRVPAGADPARLRLLGWLSDNRGRFLASAASHCPT